MTVNVEDIVDAMIEHGFTPMKQGDNAFIDYESQRCSAVGALAFLNKNLRSVCDIPDAYGITEMMVRGIEAGWRGWEGLWGAAVVHAQLDFVEGYDIGHQAFAIMTDAPRELPTVS